MGEGGRWGWVGKVVSRDVDSLDGGNGSSVCGGDSLLELAHLSG